MEAGTARMRLEEGNARFVSGTSLNMAAGYHSRRIELVAGQEPFAAVLSCSDSRVPPEIVFDQGLGDLFVIRVAGNIVTPPEIGSVEFAAKVLGTRLVVVMGHTFCGAVGAAVDALTRGAEAPSPNLGSIVEMITPQVRPLLSEPGDNDGERLVAEAVRANVRSSVRRLNENSSLLERLVAEDGLAIVGAEYSIETGVVEFLYL